MAPRRFDIIIVGGGVAGSALAIVMAEHGASVLLLEKSPAFQDRGLGEWLAPWGVREARRLGLEALLVDAGANSPRRHVSYDESLPAAAAEAAAVSLAAFVKGVAGPLCLAHPSHCQILFDRAASAGATALRGARASRIEFGPAATVAYRSEGTEGVAQAPLVVGADGRASVVGRAFGIGLHRDPPHHIFAALAVDGALGWDPSVEASGTEGDFAFLALPQGEGRLRLYGAYALDRRRRFHGPGGARAFLAAFDLCSAPANRPLLAARPAGPLRAYAGDNGRTTRPFAKGAVLIGDAAGWNDPIIGTGLASAYRDVRLVSDALKEASGVGSVAFDAYAEERAERMRRLRVAAALQARLTAEFSGAARERRRLYFEALARDPGVGAHMAAVLAGPEAVPVETFEAAHRERLFG
jgi:menaquinone-9 beta-reductase